ncbi:hypothetical protein N7454_004563 [Penicillium verhagenii]|nr:hypothetical protein N7454_004563 [Penicillium verhagenii]
MRFFSQRLGEFQPTFLIVFLCLISIAARVSADPAATTDAQTTDDLSTTTASTTSTTDSTTTTSTTSSSSTTSTSMTSTTSSSSTSSTTSDSSTTTSSVSTTTGSTSSSSSSSSTTTAAAIVTVPPSAGAPYMQTSNTPEGTVFIAVGAILGFIGLAVLAWRGMVAWSVNRSVRRAAMAQSAESKRLLRGSRKKRSTPVYSSAPAMDVSLDKLGTATRASYKPSRRVPSNNSALFYSPTAGGGAGSHNSLNTPAGNRNSNYLPAGFYAAAGSSTPVRDSVNPSYPSGSPSLPPTATYHDAPHNTRHSYVGDSTSSLNLNQAPGGRAPSAYLEDLFESHTSPRNSEAGRR